jgi:hypothetical protein
MTTYRVAVGADVALGSLADMTPQPRSTGIQYTRRTYAADDSVYEEGPFVELEWDYIESPTAYVTLLTQFSLHDSLTNIVTVYVRNDQFTFVRMNGKAVRPEMGRELRWDKFFPRNLTILVKNLTTAA